MYIYIYIYRNQLKMFKAAWGGGVVGALVPEAAPVPQPLCAVPQVRVESCCCGAGCLFLKLFSKFEYVYIYINIYIYISIYIYIYI